MYLSVARRVGLHRPAVLCLPVFRPCLLREYVHPPASVSSTSSSPKPPDLNPTDQNPAQLVGILKAYAQKKEPHRNIAEAKAVFERILEKSTDHTQKRRAYAHLLDLHLAPYTPFRGGHPLPLTVLDTVNRISDRLLASTLHPSAPLLNRILHAHSLVVPADYEGARRAFHAYCSQGVLADRFSFGEMGVIAARLGQPRIVRELIAERTRWAVPADTHAYASLIHAHAIGRNAQGMISALHLCRSAGLVISSAMWLELARGLVHCEHLHAAIETLERVGIGSGPAPWEYLLRICRKKKDTQSEQRVLAGMARLGIQSSMVNV